MDNNKYINQDDDQITELIKIIGGDNIWTSEDYFLCKSKAEAIYNAGYRKQAKDINNRNLKAQIARLQRRINVYEKRKSDLETCKSDLSTHGHWSLGYHTGRLSAMEESLDILEDIFNE